MGQRDRHQEKILSKNPMPLSETEPAAIRCQYSLKRLERVCALKKASFGVKKNTIIIWEINPNVEEMKTDSTRNAKAVLK
jgi:hypothetical protein